MNFDWNTIIWPCEFKTRGSGWIQQEQPWLIILNCNIHALMYQWKIKFHSSSSSPRIQQQQSKPLTSRYPCVLNLQPEGLVKHITASQDLVAKKTSDLGQNINRAHKVWHFISTTWRIALEQIGKQSGACEPTEGKLIEIDSELTTMKH